MALALRRIPLEIMVDEVSNNHQLDQLRQHCDMANISLQLQLKDKPKCKFFKNYDSPAFALNFIQFMEREQPEDEC
mgnify:CR=1 FL=1